MKRKISGVLLIALGAPAILALASNRAKKTFTGEDARKSLDAFNERFIEACLKMDNPAAAALWTDDGADLIQGMAPMIGKTKIAEWLNGLTPQLAGAKMIYCTVDWQHSEIHGDLAYEWGINKQKIEFPAPRKPFEGEGKILLILKRQGDGSWKVAVESWNSNPEREVKR